MKTKDNLYLLVGTILLAASIAFFFDPHGIVAGGATGLAIVSSYWFGEIGLNVPLWFLNIVINLPLFVAGFIVFGFKFLARTTFATVFLSVALYFMEMIPRPETDLVVASIIGGAICGGGIGLVFRGSATTGGSELAAMLVKKVIKHVSLSRIIFVIDAIIILLGLFVFGFTATMYAIIAVYISTKVIEAVLEGLSFAKAAFIISDESEKIASQLISTLDRGVTALYGKGMYTGNEKNVLLCVVSVKEIVKLKEVASQIDKNSFIIVADVREALGEGFQPIGQ